MLFLQAAVRSSRRKRNQYVVDLRDLVIDLRRRRHEAMTQNELLKQLNILWERLCSEVESEIQDGVRQQLNFNIPSFEEAMMNSKRFSEEENHEIDSKLSSLNHSASHRIHSDHDLNNSDLDNSEDRLLSNISHENHRLLNTHESQKESVCTDEIMTNLLLSNDGLLGFESQDRGAMEL